MSAARLRIVDADFEEVGDQREGDRRRSDRRAPRFKLDPAFAATLINHVTPAERVCHGGYAPPKGLRAGIAFDLTA